MRARTQLAVFVAVVLLGLGAAWLIGRSPAPPPGEAGPDASPPGSTIGDARAQAVASRTPGERRAGPAAGPLELRPARVSLSADAGAAVFAGQVISSGSGAPVAAAELTFAAEEGVHSAVSGPEGQFEFRAPKPGTYKLAAVLAEGFQPFAPEWGRTPIVLMARPGLRVEGLVVSLVPAVSYRGLVLGPDGRPVADAQIRLTPPRETRNETALAPIPDRFASGPDGTFVFQAPDYSTLVAYHPGFAPGRGTVDFRVQVSKQLTLRLGPAAAGEDGKPDDEIRPAPAEAPADASAAAAGRISGQVRKRSDGAPVPAFTVVVSLRRGPLAEGAVAGAEVIDPAGEYAVSGLAAGDYRVRAAAFGLAPSEPVDVALRQDGDTARADFFLLAGGSVSGVVRDDKSRQPIEGAKLTVEGQQAQGSSVLPVVASTLTDPAGRFALRGLAPGLGSLTVAASGHHGRIVSNLQVTEGGAIGPLEITLTPLADGEEPMLELVGIGVALHAQDDALIVDRVIAGGGAAAAGLVPSDAILAVDSVPVVELGFAGAIQRIRGPEGTTVLLAVRKADSTELQLQAVRSKVRD